MEVHVGVEVVLRLYLAVVLASVGQVELKWQPDLDLCFRVVVGL